MDEPARRTTMPVAGRSPARRGATADAPPGVGAAVSAALGLLVTAAIGSALVATVLAEATPGTAGATADRPTAEQGPVDPGLLRLWGLRAGTDGTLTPLRSTDPAPATPLEELYATLRPAR